MIVVSLLGALGVYMRRDSSGGDLYLVLHLANWYWWSGALVAVALHRYYCLWHSAVCKGPDCLETTPGAVMCVLAIFVWASFLTSSAISADFGLALMMLVCILIEGWLFSRHWERLKCKLKGVLQWKD